MLLLSRPIEENYL